MVLRKDGAVVYGYTTTATPLLLSLTSKNHHSMFRANRNAQNKNLWSVQLNDRPAGGEYNISLSNQYELISLIQNVTFGEVIFCASNLGEIVHNTNRKKDIKKGDDVRVHIIAPNPEPYKQIATKIFPQPEWISSNLLGKTSMHMLATLCAQSHRNHKNMPVGIFVSLYPNSELEAYYPALEQLKCIGESRCVGRIPMIPLSESNYIHCSQRPRESEESFWIPGNAQLYNGMISPYALNQVSGIVLYTSTYQVQKMHCTLNRLARSWIRAFTSRHDTTTSQLPFLCVFNDASNHKLQYRVLPSVDEPTNNKTTFLSSSPSLSSRIRNIMALEP